MSKVKVSDSVTQSVTRSPIELLWTAKKGHLGMLHAGTLHHMINDNY